MSTFLTAYTLFDWLFCPLYCLLALYGAIKHELTSLKWIHLALTGLFLCSNYEGCRPQFLTTAFGSFAITQCLTQKHKASQLITTLLRRDEVIHPFHTSYKLAAVHLCWLSLDVNRDIPPCEKHIDPSLWPQTVKQDYLSNNRADLISGDMSGHVWPHWHRTVLTDLIYCQTADLLKLLLWIVSS